MFDFSNYPKDSKFFHQPNKKVFDKMKDVSEGKIIDEFVGLKSNMYSMKSIDGKESNTAKGDAPLMLQDLAWAICMILIMEGSPFCFHGCYVAVKYFSWLHTHPTPLCQWPYLQQICTQAVAKNHHPSTICQHTPAPTFPHPQFPSFWKSQLKSPAHNIVINLPHCFYTSISWQ